MPGVHAPPNRVAVQPDCAKLTLRYHAMLPARKLRNRPADRRWVVIRTVCVRLPVHPDSVAAAALPVCVGRYVFEPSGASNGAGVQAITIVRSRARSRCAWASRYSGLDTISMNAARDGYSTSSTASQS